MANATHFIPDSLRHVGVAIVLAVSLVGCGGNDASDRPAPRLPASTRRTARPGTPEHAGPAILGAFPELRERRVSIPETREGMLDIYALRECHITTLVAERNSTLGRVAPASQRWQYEARGWRRHSVMPVERRARAARRG